MSSTRLIRNDLKFLLFADLYNRLEEPKAKRRAFMLLEAAIQCFSRNGFENVTLQMIAHEAGVTRPLLRHYFNDLDDIRETSVKYIRLLFQKIAVNELEKGKDAEDALELYILSCFHWAENLKTHARVWFAFLHLCSHQKRYRKINSEAVIVGERRIISLIEYGVSSGAFVTKDTARAAKMIQTLITGALVTVGSEDYDPQQMAKYVLSECLKMVKA